MDFVTEVTKNLETIAVLVSLLSVFIFKIWEKLFLTRLTFRDIVRLQLI